MILGQRPKAGFMGALPPNPCKGEYFPLDPYMCFQIYRCMRNTRDNPYPNLFTSADSSDRTPRRHKLRSTPFDRKGRISVPLRCSSFSQKVKDFLGTLINGKATYGSFPYPRFPFGLFFPPPPYLSPLRFLWRALDDSTIQYVGQAVQTHLAAWRKHYKVLLSARCDGQRSRHYWELPPYALLIYVLNSHRVHIILDHLYIYTKLSRSLYGDGIIL